MIIIDKALSALFNKINDKFLSKLKKDNNTIIAKTQLHFFSIM